MSRDPKPTEEQLDGLRDLNRVLFSTAAPTVARREIDRVLVFGGRDYNDEERLFAELDALEPRPTHLVHGGAPGADRLAGIWGELRGLVVDEVHAEWDVHGRAAGPIRNQHMIDAYHPRRAVGFPGGRGTADMTRRLKAAGIPLREVRR